MVKFLGAGALVFFAAMAIAIGVRPQLRAALIAELNDAANLPALEADPRIHYEPDARDCAEAVAAVLPAAISKIEAEHGRAFAKAPIVGVYASPANYARANGLGDADVAGVSRAGRALLSPRLCGPERYRLASVLTHELSHVHFFGWRPRKAPRPPTWFTEGLAVLASDGGAAESVSDAQAADAIRKGYGVILDDTNWSDFLAIPFAGPPPCDGCDPRSFRQRLAFRQAAIFIGWLRKENPEGFSRLMRKLEGGGDFEGAFEGAFGTPATMRWRVFEASVRDGR